MVPTDVARAAAQAAGPQHAQGGDEGDRDGECHEHHRDARRGDGPDELDVEDG